MSGPGYLMTLAEKQERQRQMVELWRDGHQPSDIAKRFGMTANYVRLVLKNDGIDLDEEAGRPRVDTIWDMPENDRRQAIAKRAALAAREQRYANRQALPSLIPAIPHSPQKGGLRG